MAEGGGKRNERAGLIKDGGVLRSRDGEGGKRRCAQRSGECCAPLEAMDEEEEGGCCGMKASLGAAGELGQCRTCWAGVFAACGSAEEWKHSMGPQEKLPLFERKSGCWNHICLGPMGDRRATSTNALAAHVSCSRALITSLLGFWCLTRARRCKENAGTPFPTPLHPPRLRRLLSPFPANCQDQTQLQTA